MSLEQDQQSYDVVVLGAGAAGLMCAIEAGKRGRRVLLLDHAERVGKKIIISGGGRCNFTNLRTTPANYISENQHFAKSALARYTPQDFLALIEKHKILWHEKTLGQLFCDRSAQQVTTMLQAECREAGVVILLETAVVSVESVGDGFVVVTTRGQIRAGAVVVATGGLSIPKMGATGIGYDVARAFGLRIVEPRAALVPLVFSPEDEVRWCDLSGLSAEVVASAPAAKVGRGAAPAFREKMLVTHRGLSGPAVLQVSSYWQPGQKVVFDLAPGREVFDLMMAPDAIRESEAATYYLRDVLPARLAERWVAQNIPPDWKTRSVEAMEAKLHRWEFVPAGTEGYAKAEVTAGGVSTAELDSTSMEAKKAPGLYFIGEVVDVTGHLGGYNFQWAWASGAAAGRAV